MRTRHHPPDTARPSPKNRGKAEKKPPPLPVGGQDRHFAANQWLYGLHAVRAALANPNRRLGRILLTPSAMESLGPHLLSRVKAESLPAHEIERVLPKGAVHQGAALEVWPLRNRTLDHLLKEGPTIGRRIVLVLDQLMDPHNVGAILRSAAAFDVSAVIVQDRHAPPQTGALAKAACGALDMVDYIEVVNIVRALDELARHGFWRVALCAEGDTEFGDLPQGDIALVLGSEGSGIRRLVREHCEGAVAIAVSRRIGSLNVSNAAAIALYELRRRI